MENNKSVDKSVDEIIDEIVDELIKDGHDDKLIKNKMFRVEFIKDSDGNYHTSMGCPSLTLYSDNKRYLERWYTHGKLDSPSLYGNSAQIIYYDNDKINSKYWYKNGLKHRDGGDPAVIKYGTDGNIIEESWYQNGELHYSSSEEENNDKPARKFYVGGSLEYEEWYQHGKLHRECNKPAVIEYNNGKIVSKSWFYDDKLHNEDNRPAIVEYDNDGIPTYIEYYTHGKKVQPFMTSIPLVHKVNSLDPDQQKKVLEFIKLMGY